MIMSANNDQEVDAVIQALKKSVEQRGFFLTDFYSQ